jgi:cytochrome c-type biogenesis protein CcmH/NrfG
MSKKLRIALYVLLGGLALALILVAVFPLIFRSIGRHEFVKAGEREKELAEFREAHRTLAGADYEKAQDLEYLKNASWKRTVKAFSIAHNMNSSALNDDDFVSMGEARLRQMPIWGSSRNTYKGTDDIVEAIIADAEAALRLNPKNKKAYALMVSTYIFSFNPAAEAKALEVCERVKTVLPDDLDLQYSCAMTIVDDDESKKRILMKIVGLDPVHFANIYLARTLRDERKFDEGIELLENMLDNDPELYLRRIAEDQQKSLRSYKETLEKNQAALAENPDDFEATKALADIYMWLNDSELSLQWYEKAYKLDPDDRDIMFWLPRQREVAGDVDGAAELYRKRLKNAKDDDSRDMVIEDLGTLYIRAGDMEQGVAWSERLDPKSSHALRLIHEIACYYRASGDDVLAYKYSEEFVRRWELD